jgi:hypothetical protein
MNSKFRALSMPIQCGALSMPVHFLFMVVGSSSCLVGVQFLVDANVSLLFKYLYCHSLPCSFPSSSLLVISIPRYFTYMLVLITR